MNGEVSTVSSLPGDARWRRRCASQTIGALVLSRPDIFETGICDLQLLRR
jgi:hypothetical protein